MCEIFHKIFHGLSIRIVAKEKDCFKEMQNFVENGANNKANPNHNTRQEIAYTFMYKM